MPTVKNVVKDEEWNITFNIMAYRELSEAEMRVAIRSFQTTKTGRKLKKDTIYEILTVFGARD